MEQPFEEKALIKKYVIGVDVSRWQAKVDWKVLKQNGVEFVIIKASQGNYLTDTRLKEHLEGASKAGLITALYHWLDPLIGGEQQAQYFLNATKGLKYSFIAADVEQYWSDWSQWGKGKITSILSPTRIANCLKIFLDYLDTRKDCNLVVYSRANFLNNYAYPAASWISGYPLWLAYYPFSTARVKVTWEQLKEQYDLPAGPPLPRGASKWTFWQFSGDKFSLPGVSSAIDLNVFNGTRADLYKFAKLPAPAEPPKPEPPKPEPPKPEEPKPDPTPEPTPPPDNANDSGSGGVPPADNGSVTIEARLAKLEAEARKNGWQI